MNALARKDALARHFLATGAARREVQDLIANGGLNPAYRDNSHVEWLVADAMAARAVMVGEARALPPLRVGRSAGLRPEPQERLGLSAAAANARKSA